MFEPWTIPEGISAQILGIYLRVPGPSAELATPGAYEIRARVGAHWATATLTVLPKGFYMGYVTHRAWGYEEEIVAANKRVEAFLASCTDTKVALQQADEHLRAGIGYSCACPAFELSLAPQGRLRCSVRLRVGE